MKIYHNPRCSKSRETLKIIEDRGESVEIIEYLKNPLSEEEIRALKNLLKLPLSSMVRIKEDLFLELKLNLSDEDKVIKAIAANPILLERPIVTSGNKAIIGRPPEKVLELF